MKNIKIIFVLSLIFVMGSCEKATNDFNIYNLGSEFSISDNGYSSLDTDVTLSIDNPLKNLSEVKVTATGLTSPEGPDDPNNPYNPPVVDLGTISLTDGVGSMTISSADLGITEAGWTADFSFDAVINGKPFTRYSHITVDDPMHLTSPYVWAPNDDGDLEETPVTVYQNDDVQYIKYEVSPERATVGSIKIETKIGANGAYIEVPGSFDPAFDSLSVVGSNFNPADTVYYMFTAKSGAREQVGELNFVVNTVEFPNTGGGTLATLAPNGFDLVSNQVVPTGSDTTDMNFVHAVLTSVGFESSNGTLFVITNESVYANNDVVEAKAIFDAGSQQSGFANVAAGDYFIYKTMRGADEYYGIIKITAAYLATSGDGDYFEFEYIY